MTVPSMLARTSSFATTRPDSSGEENEEMLIWE
jgi:hypothetical protein